MSHQVPPPLPPPPPSAGLDSDFFDATYRATDAVLLAPDDFSVNGPWPYPCQGLQGTDSLYPFRVNESLWAAFVGTSHQETPDPWPQPGGGKWPVSLATAPGEAARAVASPLGPCVLTPSAALLTSLASQRWPGLGRGTIPAAAHPLQLPAST